MDGIHGIKREKHLTASTVRCSDITALGEELDPAKVRGIIKSSSDELVVITRDGDGKLCSVTAYGDTMLGKEAVGAKIAALLHSSGVDMQYMSLSETSATVYFSEADGVRAWEILQKMI